MKNNNKILKEESRITDKQMKFCEEYLVDLNATQAAIRAGYSIKTARSIGNRLLTNVDIRRCIDKLKEKQSQRTQISADRVLKEVARLAFYDIRKAFDEDGRLKNPKDLDDDTAAAIANIEALYSRLPGKKEILQGVKKIRMVDKGANLERLMKYLQLFEPMEKPLEQKETHNFYDMSIDELEQFMAKRLQETRRQNMMKQKPVRRADFKIEKG